MNYCHVRNKINNIDEKILVLDNTIDLELYPTYKEKISYEENEDCGLKISLLKNTYYSQNELKTIISNTCIF